MVNAIICCAKEVRALIVLDIECNLSCKFVKNCRIIGLDIGQKKQIMSEVCMIKKKGPHSTVYWERDKKRFKCKVNLSNSKNPA